MTYDENKPSKEQAEMEMRYPKMVAAHNFRVSETQKYLVDTSETRPGLFETMVFPDKKIGEHWVDDMTNPYRHAWETFDDRKEAKEYHMKWVAFLKGESDEPPEYRTNC